MRACRMGEHGIFRSYHREWQLESVQTDRRRDEFREACGGQEVGTLSNPGAPENGA